MTGDGATMGTTTDRPDDAAIASDAGRDTAAENAGEPMPTPFDALGRELLAIRSFAASLVVLCDAALTNYRVCQLGTASRDAVRFETAEDGAAALASVIERLRNGGRAPGTPPRSFGEHAFTERAAADDETPGGLRVPPIGGEVPST